MAKTSKHFSTPSKLETVESAPSKAEDVSTGGVDSEPAVDRIPTNVPTVYADQLMDIVYGVHTSKLVFGIENGLGIRPVGVVVIPTASLFASVLAINKNLSSPGMAAEMSKRFAGVLSMMQSGNSEA